VPFPVQKKKLRSSLVWQSPSVNKALQVLRSPGSEDAQGIAPKETIRAVTTSLMQFLHTACSMILNGDISQNSNKILSTQASRVTQLAPAESFLVFLAMKTLRHASCDD
jgi:hypothetical protein